jgi:hypothetical protein
MTSAPRSVSPAAARVARVPCRQRD